MLSSFRRARARTRAVQSGRAAAAAVVVDGTQAIKDYKAAELAREQGGAQLPSSPSEAAKPGTSRHQRKQQ